MDKKIRLDHLYYKFQSCIIKSHFVCARACVPYVFKFMVPVPVSLFVPMVGLHKRLLVKGAYEFGARQSKATRDSSLLWHDLVPIWIGSRLSLGFDLGYQMFWISFYHPFLSNWDLWNAICPDKCIKVGNFLLTLKSVFSGCKGFKSSISC